MRWSMECYAVTSVSSFSGGKLWSLILRANEEETFSALLSNFKHHVAACANDVA